MDPISTRALQLATLTLMKGAGGALNNADLFLYKSPVDPTINTVLADLTPCDFDGYADADAQVFGAPFIDQDGLTKIAAPSVQFTCTGSTTPNVVYGWGLKNAGDTTLYYAAKFPAPIPMSAADQAIIVEVIIPWGA